MKFTLRHFVILVSILGIGFVLGRIYTLTTTGYVYEVREKKTFDSSNGSVEWRYVTKTVGVPVMDPGTTELAYKGRLLYSALRGARESAPFAKNVRFDGKSLLWDDGELSFTLQIEELKVANPTQ